jgi:MarR family transcriptional regulator, organic hydroperoxide resistance regulator
VGTPPEMDQLDSKIFESMGELGEAMIAKGEQVAQRFGVPAFCLKALHELGSPMAMRDLGRRLHCDPSFVTAIADLMESRGLVQREASTTDRRIKNLVLTAAGVGLREQVEQEFRKIMPWRCLDDDERASLLSLIRKMIRAESGAQDRTTTTTTTPPTTGGQRAGEVSETLVTAQPGG